MSARRSVSCRLLAWDWYSQWVTMWYQTKVRTEAWRWKAHVSTQLSILTDSRHVPFRENSNKSVSVSLQTVSLSPTADISADSSSSLYGTTSADSTPLNTKHPSFEVQLPENSKQRVNKGFRVSEILGNTNSYRNSILEFFTNFAK